MKFLNYILILMKRFVMVILPLLKFLTTLPIRTGKHHRRDSKHQLQIAQLIDRKQRKAGAIHYGWMWRSPDSLSLRVLWKR